MIAHRKFISMSLENLQNKKIKDYKNIEGEWIYSPSFFEKMKLQKNEILYDIYTLYRYNKNIIILYGPQR